MKNKKIIISLAIIIIVALAVGITICLKNKSKSLKELVYLGKYYERLELENSYVFTNYNDFKEKTNSDVLTSADFKKNNYAVAKISYDSCAEGDFDIKGYKIQDDTAILSLTYESSCGVCAMMHDYYLIPLDKDVTKIDVVLDSKSRNTPHCNSFVSYKPMIYLYPEEITEVTVKLGKPELLTTTYPKYNDSWNVTAYPNGDLKDNNKTYYGLYWEGLNTLNPTFEDGFVVSKENLISFLEEKLNILGLTEREANEFIIYWLPILEQNEFNLIRFESIEEINNQMPLIINPTPDSIIRVLMEYKPLDKEIDIKEQKLTTPVREGFTLVEWGGTIIK